MKRTNYKYNSNYSSKKKIDVIFLFNIDKIKILNQPMSYTISASFGHWVLAQHYSQGEWENFQHYSQNFTFGIHIYFSSSDN